MAEPERDERPDGASAASVGAEASEDGEANATAEPAVEQRGSVWQRVIERAKAGARQRRAALAAPGGRVRFATRIVLVLLVADALRRVVLPMFKDMSLFGVHDWDSHAAGRQLVVITLRQYLEGPWWNPWFCGGYPAWAHSEGATNVVSPYLPVYLTLPIQVALRIEVLGQAILGVVATYLLAGRFTRSVAVRVAVAMVFALNGRWALQAAVGHTWHLQYAMLPLTLYFFDVALEKGLKYAVYAGISLALLPYWGAVYPSPHTTLVVGTYAILMAFVRWTPRPLLALAITGVTSFGFAAPKLLPVADLMSRYPRTIESTEFSPWAHLPPFFLDRNQSIVAPPFDTPPWSWHEFGIYIGWGGVALLAVGLVFGLERRAIVLKIMGVLFMLLGVGAFHPYAPWTLLHKVPPFTSQHVPSRFLYPGTLLLGLAFASFAGGRIDRLIARRPWVDLLLLAPAWLLAADITAVGAKSTEHSFVKAMFPGKPSPTFVQAYGPTGYYAPTEWQGLNLIAMRENVGVLKCYGVGDIDVGAVAKGAFSYHGEVYFPAGAGNAVITEWSPDHAVVEYAGAKPGEILKYNMNWDSSWKANGRPALDVDKAVATQVTADHGRVVFRYWPRTLPLGIAILGLTIMGCVWREIRDDARAIRRWIVARRAVTPRSRGAQ